MTRRHSIPLLLLCAALGACAAPAPVASGPTPPAPVERPPAEPEREVALRPSGQTAGPPEAAETPLADQAATASESRPLPAEPPAAPEIAQAPPPVVRHDPAPPPPVVLVPEPSPAAVDPAAAGAEPASAPPVMASALHPRNDAGQGVGAVPGPPPPVVSGATDGLEVAWWLIDDTDGQVGAALSGYLHPPYPQDEALRARWHASGLRMVRIPGERWGALISDLPAVQPRYRVWLGWATEWVDLFRGRRIGGEAPVIVSGLPTAQPRGVLRMLARCWPAPAGADGVPRVRIEVVFQVHTEPVFGTADLLEAPRIAPSLADGPVIEELTLSAVLEEGGLYLITAEAPGVDWSTAGDRERREASRRPRDADAPADAPEHGVRPPMEIGPPVTLPMTAGEAMLTSGAGSHALNPQRRLKAVVVLHPRAARPFRLLP